MPPKLQSSRDTHVAAVRKRKKQSSEEQMSGKRPRRHSPEDKGMRLRKGKNPGPLQAEVLQHVESCINTAVLSVLSRKKVTAFQPIQVHLSLLKQRLLHLCKDMKVPATKFSKLRNLARDVLEEQRKMEEYEDTLESLNHEIEEAVEMTNKIEESTVTLEGKIETLKQEETSQAADQLLSNQDPLQLPEGTFQAPTMQDETKKLHNPELILKEVSQACADPVYKRLQNLLPMCYAEISSLMLVLTCSSKLATLRRLLAHSFPESLKVCGALHRVIDKNPFRLQVVVDQWPDFTSVICRPPLEEMTDPSDPYTNTYFLFSKDPQGLRQFLQDPQTVNWKQTLQIQGCQPALTGVLQEVSSKHGSQMHTTSNLLYMKDKMGSEDLEKISKLSSDEFQYTPLHPHEAPLVNDQWMYGKNQHSLRFVERCIQTFPSICARKKGMDQPIAWALADHSVEIRMGYTLPAYRKLGLSNIILLKFSALNHGTGFPIYACTAPDNRGGQAVLNRAGYQKRGRWEMWTCQQKL